MIKNFYNPFNDPVMPVYLIMIITITLVGKIVIQNIADIFRVWKINAWSDNTKLDTGAMNILDKDKDLQRLLLQIQTNVFRHKFIWVNRDWVVDNLSKIITKLAMKEDKDDFLLNVYQEAVNAQAVEDRLKKEQDKITKDLE